MTPPTPPNAPDDAPLTALVDAARAVAAWWQGVGSEYLTEQVDVTAALDALCVAVEAYQ